MPSVDQVGMLCGCGNKPAHPWEPGEWCPPERVIPSEDAIREAERFGEVEGRVPLDDWKS
jgi:hypothetical protein